MNIKAKITRYYFSASAVDVDVDVAVAPAICGVCAVLCL